MMTREQAVEYFLQLAVDFAVVEGMYVADTDAKAGELPSGTDPVKHYHNMHARYENCARWLLGLPRYYDTGEDD